MEEEIALAKKARENAYAPYSRFKVGAVLKTKSGKAYCGCNIENQGIQSICAERTAFAKALSEGEREFEKIIVVGAEEGKEPTEQCLPCGYCRQFMSEFVEASFQVCTLGEDGKIQEYSLEELLPHHFQM